MKLSRYAHRAVSVMDPGTDILATVPLFTRRTDGLESSRVGSGLVRAPCGEHVEGDGSGPGLLLGAERLAGERLEVFCEPPL
jgi:hypothetical protein